MIENYVPALGIEDGLRGDGRDHRYEFGCIHCARHRQVALATVLDAVVQNALILYFVI